ncbi:MAG: thiosulfate oxidation carrier complex protein SoxZ [Gammaproteobacteria bacterium]|nr:thiosulfate oxidation carrier complex protein SoxZ [Gammaproteobacteria bacterium]MCP5146394.1 thiosulfate oxidation carrier complex protein SoxZ [Gammaproteobacteria bacterium]
MTDSIRVRAERLADILELRILIAHPMTVATGEGAMRVAGHFITRVDVEYGGEVVLVAHFEQGVARNPLLVCRLRPATQTDEIAIVWRDNLGEHDRLTMMV